MVVFDLSGKLLRGEEGGHESSTNSSVVLTTVQDASLLPLSMGTKTQSRKACNHDVRLWVVKKHSKRITNGRGRGFDML